MRSLDELADRASSLEEVLQARKARKPLLRGPRIRSDYRDDYQFGSGSDSEDELKEAVPNTPELRSAFAWSLHILRSCPRITRASFPMNTELQARRIAKLIKSSLSRWQRIRLISMGGFLLEGEVLEAFLQASEGMKPFERLTLEGIEWDDAYEDEFSPSRARLRLDFKELVLLEADIPWNTAIRSFIPSATATLTILYISTYSCPDSVQLALLLKAAGRHLTTFILHAEDSDSTELYTLDSYGDTHDDYAFSLPFFRSIPPSLRTLTLHDASRITPDTILALAHSSPLLEHLDPERTIWWTGAPDHYCGCPHWEETVCLAVEHFGRLKTIHLGTLPLTVDLKLPRLEKLCQERGIELQWVCCAEEEGDSEEEESEEMLDRWARERRVAKGEASDEDDIDEDNGWVDEEGYEGAEGETDDEDHDGDHGHSNVDSDVD